MKLTRRGRVVLTALVAVVTFAVFMVLGPVQGPESVAAQDQVLVAVEAPATSEPESTGPEEAAEQVDAAAKEKVTAAVQAKLPGVVVEAVEKNEGGGYEAELSNGQEVELDDQFRVLGTVSE
jgi:ABC-type Na+ efflux pump permease subunit